MDNRYVEICGITEKEIHAYLEEELKELAETQELDYEETSQKLKERYDGYHFTANLREYNNPLAIEYLRQDGVRRLLVRDRYALLPR